MENQLLSNLVIILIVLIVLFLALRELNCWYWKINKRIEIQNRTNDLLEKLYSQLGNNVGHNIDDKSIDAKFANVVGLNLINFETLSSKEKEEIYTLLVFAKGNPGDKVVINKRTRVSKEFNKSKWENIVKSHESEEWLIIVEKE